MGHTLLWLQWYHSAMLNPIEKMWARCKNYVAMNNIRQTLKTVHYKYFTADRIGDFTPGFKNRQPRKPLSARQILTKDLIIAQVTRCWASNSRRTFCFQSRPKPSCQVMKAHWKWYVKWWNCGYMYSTRWPLSFSFLPSEDEIFQLYIQNRACKTETTT